MGTVYLLGGLIGIYILLSFKTHPFLFFLMLIGGVIYFDCYSA